MTTIPQITKDCRTAMDKSFEASKRELASIRTGKATASLLDTVRVDAYGQQNAVESGRQRLGAGAATSHRHSLG